MHNGIQHNDTQQNDIQYNSIQHNDTPQNNTQHNNKKNTTLSMMQSIVMLIVGYAQCYLCRVSHTSNLY